MATAITSSAANVQRVTPTTKQHFFGYFDRCPWAYSDPNEKREQRLMLFDFETNERIDLGTFRAPAKFTGTIRCDLHPRFDRAGKRICFDSTHEGRRQVYVYHLPPNMNCK